MVQTKSNKIIREALEKHRGNRSKKKIKAINKNCSRLGRESKIFSHRMTLMSQGREMTYKNNFTQKIEKSKETYL